MTVEFRVFGGVEADWDGRPLDLGHAQRRCVLAVLLVEAAQVVSVDQVVDRVWAQRAPQRARETLYGYLSGLRRVLDGAEDVRLVRRSGGYALVVDPMAVDLHRFRTLVGRARSADDEPAADLYGQALGLCRGPAFGALDTPWLETTRAAVERQRLAAQLDRNEVLLRLGRHRVLLPDLGDLIEAYPLDERLGGQLMLALYRSGRQAEALHAYDRLCGRLAEELGVDPGAELRRLHTAILRDEAGLGRPVDRDPPRSPAPAPAPEAPVADRPVPAQLPLDVFGFTGRAADLARLDELLDPSGTPGQAVVISAIAGTAGVGKTALAVHWAHRNAARFPDGQLFVNLCGYDPDQAVAPEAALAGFLRSLGADAASMPHGLAERAARYRTALHGRRMLVLLDNARDEEQVRPLLPGSGSCLVVVTSRDRLSGLSVREGARRVDLDALTPDEAVDLLRTLIGARVGAEPAAAAALAAQCAYLPLVLRVAAELAALRPGTGLGELVTELADERHRLDLFDSAGDARSAVRTVFGWSYRRLPADAARLFRLLGLHPGADLDGHAAAALLGADLADARERLAVLIRAHLVQETGSARYRMHDLLRAYAAELAVAEPTARAALTRLVAYYQSAASVAMDVLHPADRYRRPPVPPPTGPIPPLGTEEQAREWLDAQRANLVATVALAAGGGWPGEARLLARTIHTHLSVGGHSEDLVAVHGHAVRAARQEGDRRAEATADNDLGGAYMLLGWYAEAATRFRLALAAFEETADIAGQAKVLSNIGWVHAEHGRYPEALDHYQRSLARYQEVGDRHGEAVLLGWVGLELGRAARYPEAIDHFQRARARNRELGSAMREVEALSDLGQVLIWAGRHDETLTHSREGIELARRIGDRLHEPDLLTNLAEGLAATGRPDEALHHYDCALALATEIGQRHVQARAHDGLARVLRAGGQPDRARRHWQDSAELYAALGMPQADEARAALARLDEEHPAQYSTAPMSQTLSEP